MSLTVRPTAIIRVCSACGGDFAITPNEQALLVEIAAARGGSWQWPNRCDRCRRARRRAAYGQPANPTDNLILQCVECGGEFRFAGRDAEYFASRGFERPRRCRPCRHARGRVRG